MENVIVEAFNYAKTFQGEGEVATYIPELTNKDPEHLGISITDCKGNTYSEGDSNVKFTIQSISKTIILATALEYTSKEQVFAHVGMEPTGDSFNSIVRLEGLTKAPFNPLINAGAISVVGNLIDSLHHETFSKILELAGRLFNNPNIDYDHSVYESENRTGDKNRALVYMLKSNGVVTASGVETLDVYFKSCSILANSNEISFFGSILANDGVNPLTNERVLKRETVRIISALMTTCGMYDASGEYAIKVGLPSKSGVGGGILAVAKGMAGICAFSPRLDEKGNSYCGIKAMEYICNECDLSIF